MFRPSTLDDIVGQDTIKKRIKITLKACNRTNTVFPHAIYVGPAGTGKSTFARAIANHIGTNCHVFNGATLTTQKDILPTLFTLQNGDIIFIDEIHRISKKIQEMLYVVMEDFQLTLGTNIDIAPHTVIGATTDFGLLTKPFRDRFIHVYNLDKYSEAELFTLLKNVASPIRFMPDALKEIVKRSRLIPRVTINHFRWISDFVLASGKSCGTIKEVREGMTMIGIDERGLTNDDRRYLGFLKGKKKPIGIKTIAATLNIAEETLVSTIEPYLLECGLILKTSYGRLING